MSFDQPQHSECSDSVFTLMLLYLFTIHFGIKIDDNKTDWRHRSFRPSKSA